MRVRQSNMKGFWLSFSFINFLIRSKGKILLSREMRVTRKIFIRAAAIFFVINLTEFLKLSLHLKNYSNSNFFCWIELNWITSFKVSYVILELHNSSHLLKVCLNNANRPKRIMIITIKIQTLYMTGEIFI